MIDLDYAKLLATPVRNDPFPHVVVPDFVPPASLKRYRPICHRWASADHFPLTR